jgi:glucans biosynthesis protein C
VTSRYHYLDAARGILMILGIVYHAALVYGDAGWVIADAGHSHGFATLALSLRRFRMPAFFLMSGFFAGLTLNKYGPRAFIAKRVPRVVLPFLAALLTLNVAQLYALHVYGGADAADLGYLVSADLWGDFTSDRWTSHLWFLVCLCYYFAAAALAAALLHARAGGRALIARAGTLQTLVNRPVVCLALLPLVNLSVLALLAALPGLYRVRPLVNMDDIVEYFPFFAVGLLLFVNRRLYVSLTSFSRGMVVLTVVALLPGFIGPVVASTPGTRILATYGRLLWTWIAIYWVMVFFRAALDRPTRFATTLADSAYTIYLFHHLTVILLAWWLLDVNVSIFVKFPIVVALTFIVTFAVHHFVISKVPVLSLLFNGKRKGPT